MKQKILTYLAIPLAILVVLYLPIAWIDTEPESVTVEDIVDDYPTNLMRVTQKTELTEDEKTNIKVGYTTADMMVRSLENLLYKNGGYMRNDIMPPFVLMDNIPEYEYGYIKIYRIMAKEMYESMSKLDMDDENLALAAPAVGFTADQWGLPFMAQTETEYEKGLNYFKKYRDSLIDDNPIKGQFIPRANDLAEYIKSVKGQLDSQSKRLKASTGIAVVNTDYRQNDSNKPQPEQLVQKTPFMEIDNNFYEARGAADMALNSFVVLKKDFENILIDKNAMNEYNQMLNWLILATSDYNWFMVMPGKHYGYLPNHSGDLSGDLSSTVNSMERLIGLLTDG